MHADGGKANQYYLRGWNLDHGTDLATFWDDMPINLPTHAHGQGYTDLNWLIPETVGGLDIRKGPYWADVGDFENAGNLHISVRDSVEQNIQSVTVGSFGYARFLNLGSTKLGDGTLLYAGEFTTYNGPWTNPDDVKKFSGLLRYSQGTATDGFSLTGMAYTNTWNSTDQIALRDYTTGQIGLYGTFDPTDGGDTSRFSLSGRIAQTTDDGSWKANAYLVKYTMDLWNNYTYDTVDPVNGDQFHQHDDRVYGGGGASRTFVGTVAGLPIETVFGVQTRYDDIISQLNYSYQRQLLCTLYRRPRRRRQRRNLYREHGALDRLVADHPWLARRLFRGVSQFNAAAGKLGQFQSGARQPEIQNDDRTVRQNRIFCRRRRGLPQQRRAQHHAYPGARRSDDAGGCVAIPGALGRRRGRGSHQSHPKSRQLGQPVLPSIRIPSCSSTATPATPRRDCPASATGVEFTNDYRLASWLHIDANLALSRARFIGYDTTQAALYQSLAGYPQSADRQRARQLRLQRAMDDSLGGHHARRKDRLVQRAALALHQFAAAHRRRCLPVAAD